MKLVLFGGIAGVGKTTLLSLLKDRFGDHIIFLDPGDLFRRYFYHQRIKSVDEIEEMIVRALEKMPTHATIVVHWHYAVRRPNKYIPQISWKRLKRVAKNKKLERVVLFLISAPTGFVRARRKTDYKTKKRPRSQKNIQREMKKEQEFLAKEYAIFSRILGKERVVVVRLVNKDLGTAKKQLYRFFKKLLGS